MQQMISDNQDIYVQNLKIQLSNAIIKLIKNKKMKQKEIQSILDIKQPRVSNLMNRKIDKFSIDSLLEYLNKIGYVIVEYHEKSQEEYLNNIKRKLISSIVNIIKDNKLKQKEIQSILDIKQPRVSDLVNYKIDKFSIDSLLDYLNKIGYKVNLGVHESSKSPISIQFINVNKNLKKPTFGKKYIREQSTKEAA
jgi:predicted XRE-type DNA-binding protein